MTTKRSIRIGGRSTSVALEPEFWRVLDGMAASAGKTLAALVREQAANTPDNLASRLRVAALEGGRHGLHA
ncbi:ribbon-helix-helix domain-containing protein [Caenispirillum salinarum]|uniref:ribbon-helix-helix domain-containing protein n=1 Tax=Caenispirillum salinarum TaxID=859058 RepID=UPI00384B0756